MSAWLVLDWLRFGLAAACIAVGAVFMLGAVLGLLRFPDVFTRLHAGSGVMSLGVSVALFGVLPLCANLLMAAKILFLIVLIAALTPVLSHLVGSAAHAAGVAPIVGRYLSPRPGARSR